MDFADEPYFKCGRCLLNRRPEYFGGFEGTSTEARRQLICKDCEAGKALSKETLVWCIIGGHEKAREEFIFPQESCYICVEAASPARMKAEFSKRRRQPVPTIPEQETLRHDEDIAPMDLSPLYSERQPRNSPSERGREQPAGLPQSVPAALSSMPLEVVGVHTRLSFEDIDVARNFVLPKSTIATSTIPTGATGVRTRLCFDDIGVARGKDLVESSAIIASRQAHDIGGVPMRKCSYGYHLKAVEDFASGQKTCKACLLLKQNRRRKSTSSASSTQSSGDNEATSKDANRDSNTRNEGSATLALEHFDGSKQSLNRDSRNEVIGGEARGGASSMIKCSYGYHHKPPEDFAPGQKTCKDCLAMKARRRRMSMSSASFDATPNATSRDSNRGQEARQEEMNQVVANDLETTLGDHNLQHGERNHVVADARVHDSNATLNVDNALEGDRNIIAADCNTQHMERNNAATNDSENTLSDPHTKHVQRDGLVAHDFEEMRSDQHTQHMERNSVAVNDFVETFSDHNTHHLEGDSVAADNSEETWSDRRTQHIEQNIVVTNDFEDTWVNDHHTQHMERNSVAANDSEETWSDPHAQHRERNSVAANDSEETWSDPHTQHMERNSVGANDSEETWSDPHTQHMERNSVAANDSEETWSDPHTQHAERNSVAANDSEETWSDLHTQYTERNSVAANDSEETWSDPHTQHMERNIEVANDSNETVSDQQGDQVAERNQVATDYILGLSDDTEQTWSEHCIQCLAPQNIYSRWTRDDHIEGEQFDTEPIVEAYEDELLCTMENETGSLGWSQLLSEESEELEIEPVVGLYDDEAIPELATPTRDQLKHCAYGGHWKAMADFDTNATSCRRCLEIRAQRRPSRRAISPLSMSQAFASDDPLDQPALTPQDRALLINFRTQVAKIKMEHCPICDERWFDTRVKEHGGILGCERCRNDKNDVRKFSKENMMHPAHLPISPQLPKLTQLEEQLISPVHVVMQLRKVKGLQYKYTSHVFNLFQDRARFFNTVPLLPSELDIIILKPRVRGGESEAVQHRGDEFRVQRGAIMVWLQYLRIHHPSFRQGEHNGVTISQSRANNLPFDECMAHTLRSIDDAEVAMDLENADDVEGLRECALEPALMLNECMVPNVGTSRTEEERTHARFVPHEECEPVSMPTLASQRINEFGNVPYITDAFPTLYPDGEADLKAQRQRLVDPKEYFSHLLRLKNSRFGQHPRFRWFAANSLMRWQAKAQGSFYTRRRHNHEAQITVQNLINQFETNQNNMAQEVVRYGRNIRGSRPYWSSVRSDLFAIVQDPEVGSPHIFFTVSAADHQWPDLQRFMPIQYGEEETESKKAQIHTQNLVENPHIVAWYLHKRFKLFLDLVMKPKWSCVDMWYRFEWQARGNGHIHGFLWLPKHNNIPNPNQLDYSKDGDAQKFLEFWKADYCAINPAPNLDAAGIHPCTKEMDTLWDTKRELAEMLNKVQHHTRCLPGKCLRRDKTTHELRYRYKFPKELKEEATMERDAKGNWSMEPAQNETRLNAFNPLMILGWRANIDFRPVTTIHSVLSYITKYVSKPEYKSDPYVKIVQSVLTELPQDTRAQDVVSHILNKLIGERDYSAQEVMHLLLNVPLHSSTRDVVSMNMSPLHQQRVQVDLEGPDRLVFGKTALEYYMQRANSLEGLSFAKISRDYAREQKMDPDQKWPFQRRPIANSRVLKIYPRYPSDPEGPQYEDHCRAKMCLHHPFRNMEDMLQRSNGEHMMTWIEAYEQCKAHHNHQRLDSLDQIVPNNDEGSSSSSEDISDDESCDVLSEGLQHAQVGIQEANNIQTSNEANSDLGQRQLDLNYDWGSSTHRYTNLEEAVTYIKDQRALVGDDIVNDVDHNIDILTLTTEQRKVFDCVMEHDRSGAIIPLRINIDGVGGTGKTYLIRAISHGLAIRNTTGSPATIIRLSPIGNVAHDIGGETYHSALSIRPQTKFGPLQGSLLVRLQKRWKHVKYLIIDEKSMIGLKALGHIDARLRQAFPNSSDNFFGGLSVLLCGDFGQLGPVGDRSLFCEVSGLSGEGLEDAIQGRAAYLSFDKSITLTVVMRQACNSHEQIKFRELLSRLRDRCCTMSDWEFLATRFKVDHNGRLRMSMVELEDMKDEIRIFPRRKDVVAYNEQTLRDHGFPIKRLLANHPTGGAEARKANDDEAGGLSQKLLLSIGSKVVLTQNLWVQKGLVNGAKGIVEDIVWLDPLDVSNLPAIIFIAMPRYEGPTSWHTEVGIPMVPIPASLNMWEKQTGRGGHQLSREQFPLSLANAITVHKSQGTTLEKAVLDLSGSEFSAGLAYVAVSRVKSISGIMFEKYFQHRRICPKDPGSIIHQRKADDERRKALESW